MYRNLRMGLSILGLAAAFGLSGCDVSGEQGQHASVSGIEADPGTEPPVVTTTTLPVAWRGQEYSVELGASGGSGAYSWKVASGELPPGLELRSWSGHASLAGTATLDGVFEFALEVEDETGLQGRRDMKLGVMQLAWIIHMYLGAPEQRQQPDIIVGSSDIGQVTYALAAGSSLPPGLSLAAPYPGILIDGVPTTMYGVVLDGTPTAAGGYSFIVEATDASNGHIHLLFASVVILDPAVDLGWYLATGSGIVGQPAPGLFGFSTTWSEDIIHQPVSWVETSGNIPPGTKLIEQVLEIEKMTEAGLITVKMVNVALEGKPTQPGVYKLSFTVTYDDGSTVELKQALAIWPEPTYQ